MDVMTLSQFQNKTLWVTGIYMLVAVGITIYSLYLNHKQAKVNNQMKDLLKENKKTNILLYKIIDILNKTS